jgi:deazaflavin-dependent oxidoreductase (nitroreductase family)
MKRILGLVGMSSVVIGGIWFVRTRRPNPLRGFVTHRFNPLVMRLGLAGGRVSPWAILEHVGRTSGITYHTPIYAMTTGDHTFIRLSYGSDVHWVRNVQAAGHCRVQHHETILELDEPAIVRASENPVVPPALRTALDWTGRTYLRLHVLDRAPGTFARPTPEPVIGAITIHAPGLEMVHPPVASSTEPIKS